MKKFVKPPPAKKILVSKLNKKKADVRRRIEAIQEQKVMDAEMDLLEAMADKNGAGK